MFEKKRKPKPEGLTDQQLYTKKKERRTIFAE